MFLQIVDIVRARMALRDNTISVEEGIEGRAHQPNTTGANRITFTPKEDIGVGFEQHRMGEDEDTSRQLLTTLFMFDVAIAGYDASNPERDLAHRHKCYDLWEMVVQEVQAAYPGASQWTAAKWNIPAIHLAFGAELIATLAINVPLFDYPQVSATPQPLPLKLDPHQNPAPQP
jgi:hypothetical protein